MFNTVIISGRLTDYPELKQTTNGTAVTQFTIANESGYGDNKQTNFLSVVAWKKTAELVCKHFEKGSMIGIEGRLTSRSYTDKDGNKRKAVEIVASGVQFMERKATEEKQEAPSPAPYSSSPAQFEEMTADDDLPF
jgi:single-strand DNA-binding protein